jgi:hypothetical protein
MKSSGLNVVRLMKQISLAIVTCALVLFASRGFAQSPKPEPAPPSAVEVAPLPGSATSIPPSPVATPSVPFTPKPGASPTNTPTNSPTANPTANPTNSPTPPVVNGTPVPIAIPTPPPLVPLTPSAPPLPTSGEYQDSGGQFRVATLKGYTVTPIAGSMMAEAPDGSLAYTVISQPLNNTNSFNDDYLVEVARSAFGRGEAFQMGLKQPVPGGLKMDWTGSLTIGGRTQPMNGVILIKTGGVNRALLLLIAATEAGADQVPGAVSALSDGLQPI